MLTKHKPQQKTKSYLYYVVQSVKTNERIMMKHGAPKGSKPPIQLMDRLINGT